MGLGNVSNPSSYDTIYQKAFNQLCFLMLGISTLSFLLIKMLSEVIYMLFHHIYKLPILSR